MQQRATFVAAVVALAVTLCAGSASAQVSPDLPGPYPFGSLTASFPVTQGATLSTDVYFPRTASGAVLASACPCPLVVLGHGFLSSKERHVNQGRHLATRGFIVVIPTFKGGADHSRNADDMRVLVSWMLYLNAVAGSPFQGMVRADRIATTGHSAGGLSAILAAARDARIVATAPMDPVDVGSLGTTALAAMPRKAVLVAWSEPSACNAFGSAATLFNAAKAPKFGVRIVGGTHTDPMDPADALSQAVCGAAAPARQALYRKYVTAWLELVLHGDPRYDPRPLAAADAAANRVQAFDSLF